MADVTMNVTSTRRMSYGFAGKINGVEGKTPFLIGVSGGTASGKSTVCKRIMEKLGQVDKDHTERQVVCISQDSFYRDLTPIEKIKAEKGQFNFDHPDAFNNDLILQTLKDILAGKKSEIPAYDYRTNSLIKDQITTIYPADVVLFEGILIFYFPKIRDLFHMKLFVDTDSDTRLARRVPRDINERGRDLDYVLNQYMNFVKPAFEEFCLPTKKFADVIIPRGADNTGKKAGYCGVALYSKKKPLNISFGLQDTEFNDEGRLITAEYDNFYLVNVYVPNAGQKLVTLPKRLKWNESFKKHVQKLDESKPVIICGDMNVAHQEIDLKNPKTNTKNAGFTKEERDGMTDFLEAGYTDSFRLLYPDRTEAYTFWAYFNHARSKNIGWRLDYFIVSNRIKNNVCDILNQDQVFGSDHCPVVYYGNL